MQDRKDPLNRGTWNGIVPITRTLEASKLDLSKLNASLIVPEEAGSLAQSLLEVNWIDLGASQIHFESLPLDHNICSSETRQEKETLAAFNSLYLEHKNSPEFPAMLRDLAQKSGIPNEKRSDVWLRILFPDPANSYVDNKLDRRQEYVDLIFKYYQTEEECKADVDLQDQIRRDTDRTHPKEFFSLFENKFIQDSLKRLCFIWSKENTNIGYFQGLPDLLLPFFCSFLSSRFGKFSDINNEYNDNDLINNAGLCVKYLPAIEADTYWCISKLMFGLQSRVQFTQALHAEHMVAQLREIVTNLDPDYVEFLEKKQGIDFVIFAFRWHHCFMSRELSLKNTMVLWDYYLAEGIEGFTRLQLFIAAQYLLEIKPKLLELNDTAEIMFVLQHSPMLSWDPVKVQKLVTEAQKLRESYEFQS